MTTYGSQTNTYYAIKDHQNTIVALVDETGAVVESYEYDAYGNTKVFNASGTEIAESALGNRYCFQGREIDWATKLYYFRARWYDPGTGRWLSKDPIGIEGGLNLYVFCDNNPVNFVDPEGLTVKSKAKAVVLAAQISIQTVYQEAGPKVVRLASKGKAVATQVAKKIGPKAMLGIGAILMQAMEPTALGDSTMPAPEGFIRLSDGSLLSLEDLFGNPPDC